MAYSWKSEDGQAIVRKTEDGILPLSGGGTGIVSGISGAGTIVQASTPSVTGAVSLSYAAGYFFLRVLQTLIIFSLWEKIV